MGSGREGRRLILSAAGLAAAVALAVRGVIDLRDGSGWAMILVAVVLVAAILLRQFVLRD